MVKPQLQGCFSKLDRAEAHLQNLQVCIATYDASGDPTFRLENDFDPDTSTFSSVLAQEPVVPIAFMLLAGDALHNLRCCLDHLAHQLALLTTQRPSRRTEFPIVMSANDWFSERVKNKLIDIRPQDRARIESYQPFMRRGGMNAEDDILALLHRLDNEDKHRVIHATALRGATAVVEVASDPIDCRITEVTVLADGTPLHKGTELFRVGVARSGPNPRVHMQPELRIFPTLDDGRPIEEVVSLVYAYVHDLLLDFEQCF